MLTVKDGSLLTLNQDFYKNIIMVIKEVMKFIKRFLCSGRKTYE